MWLIDYQNTFFGKLNQAFRQKLSIPINQIHTVHSNANEKVRIHDENADQPTFESPFLITQATK
jgi:hypothetical protein